MKKTNQSLCREKKALKYINFLIEIRDDISSMKQKQGVIKNKVHLENRKVLEIENMTAEI